MSSEFKPRSNKALVVSMTQATDVDIKKLKDLILGLDQKIDSIDTRLAEVEKKIYKLDIKIDRQDKRLWLFIGLVLTTALTTILKLLAFPNP